MRNSFLERVIATRNEEMMAASWREVQPVAKPVVERVRRMHGHGLSAEDIARVEGLTVEQVKGLVT